MNSLDSPWGRAIPSRQTTASLSKSGGNHLEAQSSLDFETVELLRRSLAAVEDANVPPDLRPAALRIAADDLRNRTSQQTPTSALRGDIVPGSAVKNGAGAVQRPEAGGNGDGVLGNLPEMGDFFSAIERETGVTVSDLSDVFLIEDGRLELKIRSKDLGANKGAQTQTVTALVAGAVFAGTTVRKLAFAEIRQVCDTKHCLDTKSVARSIKRTPGFGSVGSKRAETLVTQSGWEDAFAAAVRRVLGRPDPSA